MWLETIAYYCRCVAEPARRYIRFIWGRKPVQRWTQHSVKIMSTSSLYSNFDIGHIADDSQIWHYAKLCCVMCCIFVKFTGVRAKEITWILQPQIKPDEARLSVTIKLELLIIMLFLLYGLHCHC